MYVIQQVPMILKYERRPYPMCVDEDGTIGQQSHWGHIKAVKLLGFQQSIKRNRVDLDREDWLKDPQAAVGMYPVVTDGKPLAEASMGVLPDVIETVEVVPDRRAADIP